MNLATLITGDPSVTPAVYLCLKRVGQDSAASPPLLDLALAVFATGDVPAGYDASSTGVPLGPGGSAEVLLLQTVDGEAGYAAASASADAVRTRVTGGAGGGGGGGGGLDWNEGGDMLEFDDPAAEEARRAEERARVYQMLQEAQAERQALSNDNAVLQRQLAAVFAARQPDDTDKDEKVRGRGHGWLAVAVAVAVVVAVWLCVCVVLRRASPCLLQLLVRPRRWLHGVRRHV